MNRFPERGKYIDLAFQGATAAASLSVVVIIIGIALVLLDESSLAIKRFGVFGFLFSSDWNPVTGSFGAVPAVFGTIVTTVIALSIAVPVAIGIAIFVTEIAPEFLKGPIGAAIELLAAIPSIIYGMWGLFTLAPIMAAHIEPALQNSIGRLPILGFLFRGAPMGIDLLTASVVLSIMITPLTASIARDAFNLTPAVVKESAYAIGATQWEVIRHIVIPYSRLGVFGGVALSLGRAIGETMAVAFVLGNSHNIPASLFDAASTITVTLANEFTEADTDIYHSSLFYLALVLFCLSIGVLTAAKFMLMRAEERHSK